MIELKNVSCGYNGADVVNDVSFSVPNNTCLTIAGPNGCGKTTLLRAISAILPYKGSTK